MPNQTPFQSLPVSLKNRVGVVSGTAIDDDRLKYLKAPFFCRGHHVLHESLTRLRPNCILQVYGA
jgi:hypothetical protein